MNYRNSSTGVLEMRQSFENPKTLRRFYERRNQFNREGKASSTARLTRVLPRKGFWRAREKFAPHMLHPQNAKPMLNDCRAVDRLQYYCPNKRRPTCITRGIFPHALVPLMKE